MEPKSVVVSDNVKMLGDVRRKRPQSGIRTKLRAVSSKAAGVVHCCQNKHGRGGHNIFTDNIHLLPQLTEVQYTG